MAASVARSYKIRQGVHLAIGDLIKAGMSGNPALVEEIAVRMQQDIPTGIRGEAAFRAVVARAVSTSRVPKQELLRSATASNLQVESSPGNVSGIRFNGAAHDQLQQISDEHEAAEQLLARGLEPTTKLLLSGPPGVGKTLASHWLAVQMNRPLVRLNLATTISSFLGESGRNISAAFEEARVAGAIFFIDEFDAVAKRRDDASDVGELKRLVNVVLLEIDRWSGPGLLVAATNHAQLLDEAVRRRFDVELSVPLPNPTEIGILAQDAMGQKLRQTTMRVLVSCLAGRSNSDVVRICRAANRAAIIKDTDAELALLLELCRGATSVGDKRDQLWLVLKDEWNYSTRQIAEYAPVSHDAVNDGIKRARGKAS